MNCPKLNTCPKIAMVLDKSYELECLYSEVMRLVCEECKQEL